MTELDDRPPSWTPPPRSHRRGEWDVTRWRWRRRHCGPLGRMLPYRWRAAHEAYAALAGRFWLACPLCGRMFGGHEWGDVKVSAGRDGFEWVPATVPIAEDDDNPRSVRVGAAICPRCTGARLGLIAWAAVPAGAGCRLATPAEMNHHEVDDHRRPPYADAGEDLDDEPHGYVT